MGTPRPGEADRPVPAQLFFYNAGFLRQTRLRRILTLAGHDLRLGLPGPGDGVAVWGRSPHAGRGEAVAARRCVPLVRLEDAFLRSVRPGRADRGGPLGLMVDPLGVHFDAAAPSSLERLLAAHPLDDAHLLTRARDGIARLAASDLSKYNLHDPALAPPPPGYVLVVDQTRGDAAIRHGGATDATFAEMLVTARLEHPNARIVVKTHPETAAGLRPGHFGPADAGDAITLLAAAVSPHALLSGAAAVYAVSSQMGFEAVLAGHRPVVLGRPWYAGWGLTDDRDPVPRRSRRLTRAQMFAAAMILAPLWHDPCRDRLCSFEEALDQLEAEVRAFRDDRAGHVALGMRLWKRPRVQAMFGAERRVVFRDDPAKAAALAARTGRGLLVWGDAALSGDAPRVARVEDGFLRSRGLGADLIPPLSLVADDLGLHYDPARPSRLEAVIAGPVPPGGRARAERLVARIVAAGVTKYAAARPDPTPVRADPQRPSQPGVIERDNPVTRFRQADLDAGNRAPAFSADAKQDGSTGSVAVGDPSALGGAAPLRHGTRILVPGQVEDDASVRLGAGAVRTNLGLLRAVRAANPDAWIVWKPHPDVEAGLRPGRVDPADLSGLADRAADRTDPAALFAEADEVWTITSLLGFEALLRGLRVTCLGAPFYAGWGLTTDLGPVPDRRRRAPDGHPLPRPDLTALAHAALIAYPRCFDPVSRRPCPPEVVVHRLTDSGFAAAGPANRLLGRVQGRLATHARLWRQ